MMDPVRLIFALKILGQWFSQVRLMRIVIGCGRDSETSLFTAKKYNTPSLEYLPTALMGRFLIIRVIKEHNADGYQNYRRWQCQG